MRILFATLKIRLSSNVKLLFSYTKYQKAKRLLPEMGANFTHGVYSSRGVLSHERDYQVAIGSSVFGARDYQDILAFAV